jgi:PPM family protein phosphatase
MTPGIAVKWRAGAASDRGLVRGDNQDRCFVDHERGVFLVVDGLGGHAAGEKAAEAAVEVIARELSKHSSADTAECVREAIAAANNSICDLADENEAWRGMACVLTLAVMDGERVVVGHVGDSRLYLIWNGAIHKLTTDHSPVGELEDRGELTERDAMLHPRRHEVFRNVGSHRRSPDEEDFIEVKEFLLKPDAAFLLCSDGLSDQLESREILALVERYDGDAEVVARALVDAANGSGGIDNVTAIFVGGSEFVGVTSMVMAEARVRHSVTRPRTVEAVEGERRRRGFLRVLTSRAAFLIYGFVLGVALALYWR